MFGIPRPRGIVRANLHILTLRETGSDVSPKQTNNEGPRLWRSECRRIPQRYFQIEEEIFPCTPLEVEEPTSYQEAIDSPSHKEWMDAKRDEMGSMARNKVWELVDLPPQRKSIGNKWIFKIKCRADGSIDKFKARFVAKGRRLWRDIFSYGEICLYSPTPSHGCPFGLRVVSNGRKDCFPQW